MMVILKNGRGWKIVDDDAQDALWCWDENKKIESRKKVSRHVEPLLTLAVAHLLQLLPCYAIY